MSKQVIRQRLLDQRRLLEESSGRKRSHVVQDAVLASTPFVAAEAIALYASVHNEVRTDRLFAAALSAGKKVFFPRLENGRIVFVQVHSAGDLQTGSFGVLEPSGGEIASPEDLDMVLVPGVGFDRQGHRIGYGLGYYDRALAACRNAIFLGLAYEFQVVENLPEEEHDIRLDFLVTEQGVVEFKHKQ